jgi:hypothetical protein
VAVEKVRIELPFAGAVGRVGGVINNNPHIFGVTRTRPSRRDANLRSSIAQQHGGWFVEVNVREGEAPWINGGAYRGWFEVPDKAAQQMIERALAEATR